MDIRQVDISTLKNWERNPREAVDIARLKEILQKRGQLMPLLLDGRDMKTVLGGNMRLRAMKELGWKDVTVSVVTPKDEKDAVEIALEDNDNFGKYVQTQLIELVKEFDVDRRINIEVKPLRIEDIMPQELEVGNIEDDEVPEVKEPISVLGDIYELDGHRVMCGDSTIIDQVQKLMNGKKADMVFTDPPYGMKLNADFSSMVNRPDFAREKGVKNGKKYKQVLGDNGDFTRELIDTIFANFDYCSEIFIWGADYIADLLPNRNEGSWIVWDKRIEESADKMYGSTFELCWSKARHKRMIARIKWASVFGTEKEPEHKRSHPTQKPQALVVWFFDYYSLADKKLVADLYLGSGSTLIACQKTNRICYGMELDPKYVDVIVNRWCEFTGKYDITRNGEKINWKELQSATRKDI